MEPPPPSDPVAGMIYDGRVANITGFGAFVALEGFRKKVEGLVHISQLRKEGRVTSVEEVVTRNQRVKVKVLNVVGGGKMSLSLKDVDQATGEDLNPDDPNLSGSLTGANAGPLGADSRDSLRNPDRPGRVTNAVLFPADSFTIDRK